MTRAEFTTGYVQRMRNVVQKHDNVRAARSILRECGSRPALETAYAVAQDNLTATLTELADYVYDAVEKANAA